MWLLTMTQEIIAVQAENYENENCIQSQIWFYGRGDHEGEARDKIDKFSSL